MDKIIINGKKYTFGGWALCAYEFMKYEKLEKFNYIDIIKRSKELRKRDFIKEMAIKMANFLKEYEKEIHNESGAYFVTETNSKYMIEFSTSDNMQANINILKNIIQDIQKLYNYLNIPFNQLNKYADGEGKYADEEGKYVDVEGKYADVEGKDADGEGKDADGEAIIEKNIQNIENMQLYLINLINLLNLNKKI